ncbi:outer membrane protein assembly factor BamB family protein [Cellulomonas carbonis]|uniref:Pyrrolo-quinoline quinone repeat domain-containing protein n=1 Tax=Cellulomonas carbonis T26 TaxID=947969 RepID=A0A0A0BV37_9CELL|nr:PQQ-binding-like beta-propeller repeat protein [Cellulomonas carbonis]KGM11835.1 hypothetical protein N868_06200 [Cellulomonas carbonis T26]GGB91975.1 hypothetical protein GCM10010972_00790 [Cellulomonas carbonis]
MRGSRPGPEAAAVEVELVEDDGPVAVPGRHAATPHPGRPVVVRGARGGRRHGVRALVAAVVATTVAVVGLNLGLARGERARLAALAELPGFLETVDGVLERRWSLDGARLVGAADGTVLVSTSDHMLHGVDPGTGDIRWTVGERRERGWCAVLGPRTSGPVMEHRTAWLPSLHRAVCHSTTWDTVPGDDVLRRRTTVVSVDPVSGHRAATSVLTGRLVMVHAVGGDLVHVLAEDDGRVRVVRWDPTDGRTRWDVRSDGVVAATGGIGTASVIGSTTLVVRGRGVMVLDLENGDVPPDRRDGVATTAEAGLLSDGARVLVTVGSRTRTAVLDGDGTRWSRLGVPLVPLLHGHADDVLVLRPDVESRSDRVRVVDVASGRELWRTTVHRSSSVLTQLGSVVLLAGPVRVTALDARSGAHRWDVETLASVPALPVTDGRVLLLAVPGDGGPDLVAVDVVHGHQVWRTPLPDDARAVEPAGSGLVVETRAGVEGWD